MRCASKVTMILPLIIPISQRKSCSTYLLNTNYDSLWSCNVTEVTLVKITTSFLQCSTVVDTNSLSEHALIFMPISSGTTMVPSGDIR